MNLDANRIDDFLRVVRIHLDVLAQPMGEALAAIPLEYREVVRARYEEEQAQPIRRISVLSDRNEPREWFERWDPSSGYYWRRLRSYLIDQLGRSQVVLESLDDSTDTVLSHLEDPRASGPVTFQVRGLVLGRVQSGKTANYSALIAKAADLGYKLVIVLSGIDNGLRQQTQRRLERELGLIQNEGVGVPEPGKRWVPLTSADINGDFYPGTVGHNVLQGNEHVLAVVKKNGSVLRKLVEWMREGSPPTLPVLVIDDEADQASINTGGNRSPSEDYDPADEENAPSVINGLIRQLIRSFHRIAYVAYTATPFANILIDHQAIDREVWEDLYPKDFIVSLPTLPGYVGAERLFGRGVLPGETEETEGIEVVKSVPDRDIAQLIPPAGLASSFKPQIPQSLKDAFLDFILAVAARCQRSGQDEAASMLIHTHHRTALQNQMGELVRNHVSALRQWWRYDRDSAEPLLRLRWEHEFRPLIASTDISKDLPFDSIREQLDRLFRDPLRVVVLNSSSPDILDYKDDPNMKVVVIGGNRLSRGLTIEGLLVSYYVRVVSTFDTLMQMGRWFGYRESYVDLTRLWTTTDLAERFCDVALAEEELRREIERYEYEGLTPLDFGPKIRAHPIMLATAANKMGSAQRLSQSYAGRLLQTTAFRLEDRDWLESNLSATRVFLGRLGAAEADRERLTWGGVDWRLVSDFLAEYSTDPRSTFIDLDAIRQYLNAQVALNELTLWRVAVVSRGDAGALGEEDLGILNYPKVKTIARTRLKNRPHSIGVLVNPATLDDPIGNGDEEIGLSEEQLADARNGYTLERYPDLGSALRAKRDPREGLLLLYPISKWSRPRSNSTARQPLFDDPVQEGCTVIGLALSFPSSNSAATIEYIVGSVGRSEDL